MTELLQLLVNGLVNGSVLAMAAVGLSLAFGVLKIVNYAHGDLLTVGAYSAVAINVGAGQSMVVSVLVSVVSVTILVLVIEFLLFRPLRSKGAGLLSKFFIAIGLALILRNVVSLVFGSNPQRFDIDAVKVYELGVVRLTLSQVIVIVSALIIIPLLGVMLAKTTVGRNMRAISDDNDLAAVAGVNVQRTIVYTWILSGGLAAFSGVLQGLVQNSFDPNMGFLLLLMIFAAVILGGVGSAYGALSAGLALGVIMDVATWSGFLGGLPTVYKPVIAFAVLILVLLVRPSGIFGKARVI